MLSLMIWPHAFELLYLQKYLNHCNENKGELVCASFVQRVFLQHISLTELQSWVKRRPRLDAWHLECCQVLTALHQLPKTISVKTTQDFYRELVEGQRDDGQGMKLGIKKNSVCSLFQRTFRFTIKDNFQNSSAWPCYTGALPV